VANQVCRHIKKIGKTIINKGADYVLIVKDNQKELKEQIEKIFSMGIDIRCATDIDVGHGRIETRTCTSTENLNSLDGKENWCSLRSVAQIESERNSVRFEEPCISFFPKWH
jgi:hypothetical protein